MTEEELLGRGMSINSNELPPTVRLWEVMKDTAQNETLQFLVLGHSALVVDFGKEGKVLT